MCLRERVRARAPRAKSGAVIAMHYAEQRRQVCARGAGGRVGGGGRGWGA